MARNLGPDEKLLIHAPGGPPVGFLDAIAERFPSLNVVWEQADVRDGVIESADNLPAEVLHGVTMLVAYPPASAENLRGVHFVQLISAGSDMWHGHEVFRDPRVRFASASGVHPPQIAEWVIATWLAHQHHFPVYLDQQRTEGWVSRTTDKPATDSLGLKVGILGYGAIGRNVARLCHALGMNVIAYTQNERPTLESRRHEGYSIPHTGDPDGRIPSKWFHGEPKGVIDDFLAEGLDLLAVCTPLDQSSHKLIGRKQFALMAEKKTFLSNISRGPVVDTDALVEALHQGLIRGAALDVSDPEPLPKGHPLWQAPNVFITPHIAWQSSQVFDRITTMLMQNLDRIEKGQGLLNEISKRV